jgi:hypothetical protein
MMRAIHSFWYVLDIQNQCFYCELCDDVAQSWRIIHREDLEKFDYKPDMQVKGGWVWILVEG